MLNDVYETIPVFENDQFQLRGTTKADASDLLRVYSDASALPLFNSDNCHGDNFCYDTPEKMNRALDFWSYSYETRQFVRWTVVAKAEKEAVGTIELFHRDAKDYFSNCGLLRLDLRSDYEKSPIIESVLALILPHVFKLFHCDKVATKAIPAAAERRRALRQLGFGESGEKLRGNDGKTEYDSYFVKLLREVRERV